MHAERSLWRQEDENIFQEFVGVEDGFARGVGSHAACVTARGCMRSLGRGLALLLGISPALSYLHRASLILALGGCVALFLSEGFSGAAFLWSCAGVSIARSYSGLPRRVYLRE